MSMYGKSLLAALGLLLASGAFGSVSEYQLGFGPFVGKGSISTGAQVRTATGYDLSIARNWELTDGLYLGPRFEVANSFVNAKSMHEGTSSIATYDNRIFAAGFKLSHKVGTPTSFAQGAYFSAVAGRGYSKLSIDQSSDKLFDQSLYGNISGNYFGAEIGTWIPLKGRFGLDIAMLGSLYQADQSEAPGTSAGNVIGQDGALELTASRHVPGDGSLSNQVSIRTYAAKVGLSMGF